MKFIRDSLKDSFLVDACYLKNAWEATTRFPWGVFSKIIIVKRDDPYNLLINSLKTYVNESLRENAHIISKSS